MKGLRKKLNLRVEDVAYPLGISVSSVRNWEAGRTIPKLRLDQFVLLCRMYQVGIEELEAAAMESQNKLETNDG
jgi:transcriptional regulator with XRE-family HTH domain